MASRFHGFLNSEQIDWRAGRPVFRLTAPLRYTSDLLGCTVVIPAGFVTDLASVPRRLVTWFLTGGRAPRPAVVHDFPYQFGTFTRDDGSTFEVSKDTADAVFAEAMAVDPISGTNAVTRWLMWAGVRVGGRGVWEDARRVAELNPIVRDVDAA